MTIQLLQIKFQQRLNKLASQDFDNIESWQIVEAYDKAELQVVRDLLDGKTLKRDGQGSSLFSVTDLQPLITPNHTLNGTDQGDYFVSLPLPENFMQWVDVSVKAQSGCCPGEKRNLTCWLVPIEKKSLWEKDESFKASFYFAETFAYLASNQIHICQQDEFKVCEAVLSYYRLPRGIQIAGTISPSTGKMAIKDTLPELKDDLVELIIDQAVAIIAADTENWNQAQRAGQNVAQHV
jgi:hypothetical protein